MYDSQEIARKIKHIAKSKKIALKTMLSDCELGINLISQLASGQAVTYINLAKIADYLDCSVDYLLGRENMVGNNNGGIVNSPINGAVNIHNGQEHKLTKQEQDLLRIYNAVDGKSQMKIMTLVYNLEDEYKKQNNNQNGI